MAWVPSAQLTWGHRLLEGTLPDRARGRGVADTESWAQRNTEGEKPGMRLLGAGGTKHRVGVGAATPAGHRGVWARPSRQQELRKRKMG